ncbi:unnamed protein product [Meloidogyne enterolobii]|uniref:Uncharacterized protein n=1 Tax=Meloidogyne enterolobii TaxID=390850 RepID=A0ACB1B3G9_MELEN
MELQMFCCLLGYTVLYLFVLGLSKPLCLFVSRKYKNVFPEILTYLFVFSGNLYFSGIIYLFMFPEIIFSGIITYLFVFSENLYFSGIIYLYLIFPEIYIFRNCLFIHLFPEIYIFRN